MCRGEAGIGGWQALQVIDYKAPRTSDNGLKIRVSVVRFRPWPPVNKINKLDHDFLSRHSDYEFQRSCGGK
jgi:hypothetical protein